LANKNKLQTWIIIVRVFGVVLDFYWRCGVQVENSLSYWRKTFSIFKNVAVPGTVQFVYFDQGPIQKLVWGGGQNLSTPHFDVTIIGISDFFKGLATLMLQVLVVVVVVVHNF